MKIITVIASFFALSAYGQIQAANQDTIFLDAHWNITNNRDNAKYWREMFMNPKDSVLKVHDFWLSTGNRQMIGQYMREMKPANQNGRFQYFYEDGTLKAVYDYQWGIIHGELRKYFHNGNLKSVERYDLGTKIDTSWTYFSNGQLRRVEMQNKDFSLKNPSDKYKRTQLITAFSKEGELQVEKGNGTVKEYFLSGRLKAEIEYQDGFPHGKWVKYSGHRKKKASEMVFKHGRFIKGEIYTNGKKDVFSSLRQRAYFPSGIRGLEHFLDDHIGKCDEGFHNEVIIMLNVSTTGRVAIDQILSGNTNACQYEEIQNMIRNMPRWIPAVNEGVYVESSRSITLNFSQ